jgi:sortase A
MTLPFSSHQYLPRGKPVVCLIISSLAVLLSLLGCRAPVQVSIQTQPQVVVQTAEQPATLPAEQTLAPASTPEAPSPTPTLTPQPATTTPRPPRAEALLGERAAPRVASSPPTRIVAPAISLDAPVVEVGWVVKDPAKGITEWQTADYAAGFHHGSALPGQPGNTVLSGHHNIRGKVFARLHELRPGDQIFLYVGDEAYAYRVEDKFIIPEAGVSDAQRRQNARWIAPTRDERLTLVTCWPPNGNSHRVIVIARPDPPEAPPDGLAMRGQP